MSEENSETLRSRKTNERTSVSLVRPPVWIVLLEKMKYHLLFVSTSRRLKQVLYEAPSRALEYYASVSGWSPKDTEPAICKTGGVRQAS